ncbi:MAG: DUF192 domain-containing protein [Phormidesmis sp.]
MPLPQRVRYALLPLLLYSLLASCSVADNPDSTEMPASDGVIAPFPTPQSPITLNGPGQILPITATAEMKGETFELEVTETPQERSLGLMFRSALPDHRGMLFSFDPPRPTSFWMKDVPVPLDMVFLRSGVVIAIAPSAPPCADLPCPTYGSSGELIDQVIELRGGRAAEIGLQPGDTVNIQSLAETR